MTAQETYIEAQIAVYTDYLNNTMFHYHRAYCRYRIAALQDQKTNPKRSNAYNTQYPLTKPGIRTYPQKGVTQNVIQRLQG